MIKRALKPGTVCSNFPLVRVVGLTEKLSLKLPVILSGRPRQPAYPTGGGAPACSCPRRILERELLLMTDAYTDEAVSGGWTGKCWRPGSAAWSWT